MEATMMSQPIETTIGELILAISEAARESHIDEEDIAALTQIVLNDLFAKCA